MSAFAASIFKAYDIRGIVPVSLDEGVALALGRARQLVKENWSGPTPAP